jgi:hypothetical protein
VVRTPPDEAELDQAYARLKELHGEVFGWQPPDVKGLERLGATRMRQYVRAWINEWEILNRKLMTGRGPRRGEEGASLLGRPDQFRPSGDSLGGLDPRAKCN